MKIKTNTITFKIALFKKGYSISEFAKRLDINVSYVSSIVNGKRKPSPVLAKKMADKLNVEVSDIFSVETEEV